MHPISCDTYHLSLSSVRILIHALQIIRGPSSKGDPIQSALPVFLSTLAETNEKQECFN